MRSPTAMPTCTLRCGFKGFMLNYSPETSNPIEPIDIFALYIGYFAGWNYSVKSVLNSTEPANYTGSNTNVPKQLVAVEISMLQSAGIIKETITIESLATLVMMPQRLLLLWG